MILSILIPTVPQRINFFTELTNELNDQIIKENAVNVVEIISDNSPVGEKTTGQKRNDLIKSAKGEYVWFIDDDDMIMQHAIKHVLNALKQKPDALAINGIITTDGRDMKRWYISKDYEYISDWTNGYEVFYRPTNHITPTKREIAQSIKYEDKSNFEDYAYCMELKRLGLIKTEIEIKELLYHYRYLTYNKLYK